MQSVAGETKYGDGSRSRERYLNNMWRDLGASPGASSSWTQQSMVARKNRCCIILCCMIRLLRLRLATTVGTTCCGIISTLLHVRAIFFRRGSVDHENQILSYEQWACFNQNRRCLFRKCSGCIWWVEGGPSSELRTPNFELHCPSIELRALNFELRAPSFQV